MNNLSHPDHLHLPGSWPKSCTLVHTVAYRSACGAAPLQPGRDLAHSPVSERPCGDCQIAAVGVPPCGVPAETLARDGRG